jgi:predicted DNA binding CopG/RHH family protein
MKAEELDKKFDEDEDILDYCDLATAKRPGLEISNLTINLPQWLLTAIEKEAQKIGVNTQAMIKFRLAEYYSNKTIDN